MKIKFTLDCFKEEFLNEILLSLNYKSYYDLLQNLKKINFDLELDLENGNIEETVEAQETETVEVESEVDEEDQEYRPNETKKEEQKLIDFIKNEYCEDEENEDQQNITYKLTYFEKDNGVYIESSSKKHIPKSLVKKIKKNGGKWIKKENAWKFPKNQLKVIVNDFGAEKREYVLKNPIKQKMENNLQNKSIDKIVEVGGDIVILPKHNHPMYGKKITYDNNFNMGIWDNDLKGWKFKIAKN